MATAEDPYPDLSFEELVEELSRFAWRRLSFALVRLELTLQRGHEPALPEIWAEYARRHPCDVRGARAVIALGLVTDEGKPTSKRRSRGSEPSLDEMELVPRWWRQLERIRLSFGG